MPSTEHLDSRGKATPLSPDRDIVIDCAPLFSSNAAARRETVRRIGWACRTIGFFCAINIGISSQQRNELLSQMDAFYALPDSDPIKQEVHHQCTDGGNGWTPLFGEPAYQPGTIAHVESFDCGPPLKRFASAREAARQGSHPNAWPRLPGFRPAVRSYWQSAERFGKAFLDALAEDLGLDPRFLNERCSERAPNTLRLLRYPRNETLADEVNVGIAAHTDFECFTLLYQKAPGLELMDFEANWTLVPDRPDVFTVILGDMLERWTNGTLKATGHRVPHTPWERQSVAMFFAADADCVVEPLPPFVSAGNPARYPPVTQLEHIAREWERASALRDVVAAA